MASALLYARPPVSDAAHPVAPKPWDPARDFARLQARPELRLPGARVAGALLSAYRGNRLLNAALGDRGRVLIGLMVLYLEAHPLPGTSARGATLSAVQALCRETGMCSAGRAASVLAAMRFGGYVRPERNPNDQPGCGCPINPVLSYRVAEKL